jgi:hypothetical protein
VDLILKSVNDGCFGCLLVLKDAVVPFQPELPTASNANCGQLLPSIIWLAGS